jgi:mycothiol synthase
VVAGASPSLKWHDVLPADTAAEVLALAEDVAGQVGSNPLSEASSRRVADPGLAGPLAPRHLLASRGGRLVGYLQFLPCPPAATSEPATATPGWADVVCRTTDVAAALLAQVPGRVIAWAHGSRSAVHGGATAAGWQPVRTLLQMTRELGPDLPAPHMPPGITLRAFRPGHDDQAWLDLNARAFAELPDQASWGPSDLQERVAASWFDAFGFLLAVDEDGALVGCNWTKVHQAPPLLARPPHERHDPASPADPVGEVYVLAVSPDHQGRGLGRALTLAGLHHLRDSGISTAMLYVDAANRAAVQLYEGLGLLTVDRDVAYQRASVVTASALPHRPPEAPAQ